MNENSIEKDYLYIKEFAEIAGLTDAALRHYDRLGIFNPARHGTDHESKYRFYSQMQITTVKMIRVLTEIRVPLKDIKELTENRTPEKMIKLLIQNKDKLANEIRLLQDAISVNETFIELLSEGLGITETEISVKEMPEKHIVLGGKTSFGETDEFYGEFLKFCNSYEPRINLSYPIGGYWESISDFLKKPSRPMRFFSLDPKGHEIRAAGLYLTGYTRGYYGEVSDLPERMAEFARKNELIFSGAVYNTYLFDELSIVDPKQYLLQVSAFVTEMRRAPSRNRHF